MGGRTGGLQVTLRRRVESCKSRYSTAEEIVNHLRSTYPDYHRTKYQTLIRLVHDALHSTNEKDDDDGRSASQKRKKMEEALQIRRGPSTSFDSASECGDGAVSEEPHFDLMKTLLRNSYNTAEEEEKNIEVEMGNISNTSIVNVDGVEGAKSSKGPRWFKDFGGMKDILEDLKMDLMLLYHPELPRDLGVRPITGILLYGPPGCGKTRLAHAIANETGFKFYPISSTEVVSGVSGASEEKIRDLFSEAKRTAPSIVFIDEIDAIASKRDNLQREMEKRIVTQLITCMDEPDDSDDDLPPGYVLVIGATNRLDAIDPALRRPGRFDREISLPIPDESAREDILFTLARTKKLKLDASIVLRKIARSTPGFVGADLDALVNKAGNLAIKRSKHELSQDLMSEPAEDWWKEHWSREARNKLAIKMSDFEVDALTTERGKEGGRVIEGVLNQLLIELDGAEQRRGVFVIGATNRPDAMDRAVLRPGRFGKLLYVPLPSPDDRVLILKALARKLPIDPSVDLSTIGRMKACENLSGADLAALMNEAAMAALKEKFASTEITRDRFIIKTSHFEVALSKVSPSVSDMQRQYYQRLSESLKAA